MKMTLGLAQSFWLVASIFCGLLVFANGADAGGLSVTTLDDSGPGSLREQLLNANDGDVITFAVQGTLRLSTGPLAVNKAVQICGPGANCLQIDGQAKCNVFCVSNSTGVVISDLTITNGYNQNTVPGGGGIYSVGNLSLSNCVVTGCFGDYDSGGIKSLGTLVLSRCVITDCAAYPGGCGGIGCKNLVAVDTVVAHCYAGCGGGGIGGGPLTLIRCTITDNIADLWFGGGIASGQGPVQIEDCTISDNTSRGDSGNMSGGGIFISGSQLLITNTTITGNRVFSEDDSDGAAVDARDGASVIFESCTIVSNTAVYTFPGFGKIPLRSPIHTTSGFTMRNSIVAGNGMALHYSLDPTLVAVDCVGTVTSGGCNMIQNPTNYTILGETNGNILRKNPLLGPLQDNGGPTFTHALLPGSPAIGAGNSGAVAVDQRGFSRHATCDIGAFEFTPSVPTILKREFTKDRSFCLGFRAPSGSTNVTWSSPNLRDWLPLGTAQEVSPGSFEFIDLGVSDQTNRFYQIRQP